MQEELTIGGLKPRGRLAWIRSNPPPKGARKVYQSTLEMVVWVARDRYWFDIPPDGRERWNTMFGPFAVFGERTGHPSQKPLWLAELLVKRHCPPGGTVLDPFTGAGTIPLACANLGRRYVGVDCEQHWVEVSEKRIADAARQRNLRLPLEG